ncbi:DNA polymerase III subunit gamma/tau, partial [Chamaesiphon polymorphus CCALA 037]
TWQLSQILLGQKHLKDSEIQLKHTTQPQLWLEIAILGLLELKQQPSSALPSIAAIPAMPVGTISIPTAPPPTSQPAHPPMATQPEGGHKLPPPAAPRATANPIATEDITATWERVLQQLLPASRDLFKPFGTLISISEAQAVVAMKSSTMQTIAAGKVPELAKVFSNMFGRSIAVKLEVLGKSQHQSSSISPTPSPVSPPPVESPPAPAITPPQPIESRLVPATPPPPVETPPAPAVTPPSPIESRPVPATPPPSVETPPVPVVISPPDAGDDTVDDEMADDFTDDDEDLPESTIDLQPLAPARAELLDALSPPSPPAVPVDLFVESTDFAEPPDSIDLERAANNSADELEEPEVDPELEMATNNVVKLFNGEVIDRSHELFDRIVNN